MANDKGYELLSVSNPTKGNPTEVFVLLRHENGHTISGWISAKQHFHKVE